MLLHALDYIVGPSYEVIIAGNKSDSREILDFLYTSKQLNKILIFKENNTRISNNMLFLQTYKSKDEKPLVYVCKNYVCYMPTSDFNQIENLLEN